jgi:hypothetical protein
MITTADEFDPALPRSVLCPLGSYAKRLRGTNLDFECLTQLMSPQASRSLLRLLYISLVTIAVSSCASTNTARTSATTNPPKNHAETAAVNPVPTIHVFVALADNVNQGIVPVSASLGNGGLSNSHHEDRALCLGALRVLTDGARTVPVPRRKT